MHEIAENRFNVAVKALVNPKTAPYLNASLTSAKMQSSKRFNPVIMMNAFFINFDPEVFEDMTSSEDAQKHAVRIVDNTQNPDVISKMVFDPASSDLLRIILLKPNRIFKNYHQIDLVEDDVFLLKYGPKQEHCCACRYDRDIILKAHYPMFRIVNLEEYAKLMNDLLLSKTA